MILGFSVYHWIIALTLVLALLFQGNRKGSTFYILLICIFLFYILGYRDAKSVGVDSLWYFHRFEELEGVPWSEYGAARFGTYNWLFFTLMKLIHDMPGGNFHVFNVVLAAIVILSLFFLIRKYSVSPVMSFLCYYGFLYYTLMFGILKQSAAMAIIMWAFDAIVERRPVRFTVFVLLATSFHFPALAFLPAYWISGMRFGKNYLLFLAALLLLVFLFRDQLSSLMLNAYGKDEVTSAAGSRFLANKVLIMLFIVIVGLQLRPASAEGDDVYNILLQLMGVSIVLQSFSSYGNIFERLADYYYQFVILFMPMIFEYKKEVKSRLSPSMQATARFAGPLFVGAFAIWRFISSATGDSSLYPYYFSFDPNPDWVDLAVQSFFQQL